MHDIFISYAREDTDTAHHIAEALESKGFDVWWDREIPTGSTFDAVIEKAIDEAKCIVVLWSKHSVASEWVRIEAAEGRHRNILVPILIEDVEIPLAFRRRQSANLSHWLKGNPDPVFERLIDDIKNILDKEKEAVVNENESEDFKDSRAKEPLRSKAVKSKLSRKSKVSKYVIGSGALILILAVLYFALPDKEGATSQLKIGDAFQGGIVYEVDPSGLAVKICSNLDLGFMSWYDAKDNCQNYSVDGYDDWYLPSMDELDLIYKNLFLNELGGFKKEWYWSASETDGKAWEKHFTDGFTQNDGGGNESMSFVRAVRQVTLNDLKIGDEFAGGIIFELDSTGMHGKVCSPANLGFVNWYEAKKLCDNYSEGGFDDWYLPDLDELDLIYGRLYHSDIGDFKAEWYWSSSETDGQAWEMDFTDGYHQNDGGGNESTSFVRAVRKF